MIGGATGTRTLDLLHAMQALFQLSYSPTRRRMLHQRGVAARKSFGRDRRGPQRRALFSGAASRRVSRGTLGAMATTTTEWRATLRLPGGRLECTIRRSARARHLRLTVDPRHVAVVTIPARAARNRGEAERLAESFVSEREAWLRRHLDRQARQREEVAAMGLLRDGGLF